MPKRRWIVKTGLAPTGCPPSARPGTPPARVRTESQLLDISRFPRTATHITAISQKVDKSPTCLEFSVIADVASEAQVSIGVDFDADGTVEYEQPIAALGFREQKTQITAPSRYVGINLSCTLIDLYAGVSTRTSPSFSPSAHSAQ